MRYRFGPQTGGHGSIVLGRRSARPRRMMGISQAVLAITASKELPNGNYRNGIATIDCFTAQTADRRPSAQRLLHPGVHPFVVPDRAAHAVAERRYWPAAL